MCVREGRGVCVCEREGRGVCVCERGGDLGREVCVRDLGRERI